MSPERCRPTLGMQFLIGPRPNLEAGQGSNAQSVAGPPPPQGTTKILLRFSGLSDLSTERTVAVQVSHGDLPAARRHGAIQVVSFHWER